MQDIANVEVSARADTPLASVYGAIPGWEHVFAAVKAGEREFVAELESSDLSGLGRHTSNVHSYTDVELQAFVLGLTSIGRSDEIQTKSYLTYTSHWIDDFFDSPALVDDPDQLMD